MKIIFKLRNLLIFILAFSLGVIGALFFLERQNALCRSKFSFINATVICGEKDVIKKTGYVETHNTILSFIEKEKEAGRVNEVSVYFRDLLHGPVFGINELANFAPASLLKLPLALVFMNSAETQPELLAHKVKYGSASVLSGEQAFKPRLSAAPDQPYPIEELLKFMLTYSDNVSYEVLEQFLANSPQRLELRRQAFQELGLIDPKDRVEDTINVRGYASLFRILYNVSYLNAESSEKVLGWLIESDFDQGIKAGVPSSVKVANKFGERFDLPGNQKQLHDCGIVYYPDNPYLLCVMTRGNDFQKLAEMIGEISKMVYEEFDSRKL